MSKAATWKVGCSWEMYGYLEVEASSREEAIGKAGELARICPLPENADFVEDSFRIDPDGVIAP